MAGYAAEEWDRIEELYRLNLLTVVDAHPLAAYCEAYSTWRTAVEILHTLADRDPVMHGLIVKSSGGTAIRIHVADSPATCERQGSLCVGVWHDADRPCRVGPDRFKV